MCIFKSILRSGVILAVLTAVGVGGVMAVAGPNRAKAMAEEVQTRVASWIDESIEDPTALRHQLRQLQSEYPARIADVRADLTSIQEEIRQLDREKAVAERVVAMTAEDVEALEPLLAEAASARVAHGNGLALAANIRFENRFFTLDQAVVRAAQIKQTLVAYTNRAADADHDLTYLHQQAERLSEVLIELETERAQFEAQLVQLDRQIDAIARNQRLIELMEKRKRTIEECSRYEAGSVDHVVGRLNEVRNRQEAELEFLSTGMHDVSYEDLAKLQLRSEQTPQSSGSVELAPAGKLAGTR